MGSLQMTISCGIGEESSVLLLDSKSVTSAFREILTLR